MRQEASDTQEVEPAVQRSDGPDHSVTAATKEEQRGGSTMRRGAHLIHRETVCGSWKRRRSVSATKRP